MDVRFDICCGVDVGKGGHHMTGMDRRTGEVVLDRKASQSEDAIRTALRTPIPRGRAIVVVDQPVGMSALLFAVAKAMGIDVGFITPRAMSQAALMYGGDLKTDAHDAFVISEVAMRLPRLIKPVDSKSDLRAEISVLMSYDRELTAEVTRACNRLHELLLSIHPALEQKLQGKRIQSEFYLALLGRYGGPSRM